MVTVSVLPRGTAQIRKVYSIATSDAIVLNYLHVLGDSDYKLSIDKSPIYSIIYINKCADGKKYHRNSTVQRAAVWCEAVSAPWREIVPEQPVEGAQRPCKQRRLQPLQCRTLLEVRERVCTARQREWYRRELEYQGLCLLILQGTETFCFQICPLRNVGKWKQV